MGGVYGHDAAFDLQDALHDRGRVSPLFHIHTGADHENLLAYSRVSQHPMLRTYTSCTGAPGGVGGFLRSATEI